MSVALVSLSDTSGEIHARTTTTWKNILGGKKPRGRKGRQTRSLERGRLSRGTKNKVAYNKETRRWWGGQTSDSFRTSAATPPVWQENQADSGMVGGGSDQDERFTVSRGRKEGRKEVLTLEGNFFSFSLSQERETGCTFSFQDDVKEEEGDRE